MMKQASGSARPRREHSPGASLPPRKSLDGSVVREGLLERLAPGEDNTLATVLAPLGYGKTTLLHQHVRAQDRPAIWVTLNRHDRDPVLPIGRLVEALQQILGADRRLARAIAAPGASVWSRLVPRLVAAMAELPPSTIVLDDLHEVESQDTLDVLAWLMLYVPEGSQMLIAGRSGERLPLARLRMSPGLLELGSPDLAFTDAEALTALESAGWSMTAAEAAELNRRCEGWPAGIRLATISGSQDPVTVEAAASVGGNRILEDYVRSELLAKLPPDRAEFMLHTSVLYRMSAGLCDFVLERRDSGATLRSAERANVFVTALDDQDDWYRCHDLVREASVSELERTRPDLAATLRARAAEWHAAQDQPVEAVHYQQDAGDDVATVRKMGALAQRLFGSARAATVIEWFDWAEARELQGTDPALALGGSLSFGITGEPERAERYAAVLEAMEWDGALPDGTASIAGWQALVRSFHCAHGPDQAVHDGGLACDLISETSSWRRAACTAHGLSLIVAGDLEAARSVLERAGVGEMAEGSAPNARAVGHELLAKLALDATDLDAAQQAMAIAKRIRDHGALHGQGTQALHDAVAARLAIARGNHDEARRRLVDGQRLRGQLSWAMPGLAAIARLELARAQLLLADAAGARTLILEIQDILHRRPDLGRIRDETEALRGQLKEIRSEIVGASTLTAAELRVVPMLATHLTFGEIGERLLISTNTVKTQAMSAYRKLDATSRAEAVANAVSVGLIDPAAVSAIIFVGRND